MPGSDYTLPCLRTAPTLGDRSVDAFSLCLGGRWEDRELRLMSRPGLERRFRP